MRHRLLQAPRGFREPTTTTTTTTTTPEPPMYPRIAARILARTAPHGVTRVSITRTAAGGPAGGRLLIAYSGPADSTDVQAADESWGLVIDGARCAPCDAGAGEYSVGSVHRVESWAQYSVTGRQMRSARICR